MAAIKANGGKAGVLQANLTRVLEVERLFETVVRKFRHLDIMVNTASMVLKKPLSEVTEQEYDQLFAINAKAAFFCMQAAATQMRDNGRIVNIGTSLLAVTTGFYSAYAGSKAPLEHFTRALAKEIGNRGITVNTVAPGPLNASFVHPTDSHDVTEFHRSMTQAVSSAKSRTSSPWSNFWYLPKGAGSPHRRFSSTAAMPHAKGRHNTFLGSEGWPIKGDVGHFRDSSRRSS